MKNFKFHFILIFLFGNLFQFNQLPAQVGFSKEYQFNPSPFNDVYSKAVTVCADGGLAINFYENYSSSSSLLKTDSNGVVLWRKTFQILPATYQEVESFNLIATPDSGFIYSLLVFHPMLGNYCKTVILKLDKFGNIQHSRESDWGSLAFNAHRIPILSYNKTSKIITSIVREYSYDGFSGSCCYHQAIAQLDSSFNITLQYRIENSISGVIGYEIYSSATEIYANQVHIGNFVALGGIPPNRSQILLLGIAGNIIWQKHFRNLHQLASAQLNDHIYLLSETGFTPKLFIHKIDLQGNIISTKVFDNSKRIFQPKIVASPNSTLYVSGMIVNQNPNPIPYTYNSVIMELDTTINVIQAYNSLDSAFAQSSSIEANQGIFLFTKSIPGNYFAFQVDKAYLNGNSCNMVPLSISTYDTLITDTTGFSFMNPDNISMVLPSLAVGPITTVNTTTNCGPLAINDHSSPNIDLQIYPNPVSDILHIELDNRYKTPLQIQVSDILGRRVHEKQFFDSDYDLPVPGMKKGVYFLTVSGKDILENRKFVIQ